MNNFTVEFENKYPFLIADLMEYIEEIKKNNSDLSLIDIILDYSMKNDLDVELVGDAIRSDIYLKDFVEKDCQVRKIIKSNINEMEEW